MKNIVRFFALVLCLVFAGTLMTACDKEKENTDATETTEAIETILIEDEPIGEDAACEVAFADAGIPATAAQNLSVKMENINNVDAYVIAFEWSGFSYTYTIDAVGGTIIDFVFE